ncbi:uncharacterized protein K460DRAFT_370139 [Cucurbitaria berberidis CBS 394.84]|uniref:Uncharacterized protein n=1 Tax=Cucurbitaria berberidis CBS 394.84 TaxID=1168544 RepID=A0A9P4GAV6_9PLEO|nr:uncharacterized protein K460DRAFT_370139 [Cucurbitaria berberidis CBS 394.84]KAF1842144.1 hypothetical protein K460DRAFT_370139 [Cucurbitaria berberidis CBS 394.84]
MDDGASPQRQRNHGLPHAPAQRVKSNDGDTNRPSHKRSKSGDILGSAPTLKSSIDATTKSSMADEADRQDEYADGATGAASITTALQQRQGRKRTGSLRKAAMAKMRERSSSLRNERTAVKAAAITTTISTTSSDGGANSHPFNYDKVPQNSFSLDSGWPQSSTMSQASFAAGNDSLDEVERPTPQLHASSTGTPVRPYASTTDEDDMASFSHPSASSSTSSFNATAQGLPAMSLSRRRSNRSERRTSPVIDEPPSALGLDDEWDYSETEWWGWIVLLVTWIVFVVGMGSCLGVWSWAWDVGETPYAPPELEDDATLPITGYYPALIVCTAVMSWVWVVVAWVGMKYFRHAKVVSDDG